MKVKDFFETVKSTQTIEIVYNKKHSDFNGRFVETKVVRTGLFGKLLDRYILMNLKEREIYATTAKENRVVLLLADEEETK